MPPPRGRHRWQDSVGKNTIQRIVRSLIPSWTNGLYDWQLDVISRLLDGEDVLLVTATGDGKSAIFGIPILVLLEIARNPLAYPDFPHPEKPVGIVITPTKGLSANMVFELQNIGIKALAYDSDTLTEARKSGRSLAAEIAECQWPIVCIDPEHLMEKEWELVTNHHVFRTNVRFASVDESHLIIQWGLSFRPPFRHIGAFIRGRLPSSNLAVAGLTATLQPGPDTHFVCQSLGLVKGAFYLLRRSNERPNIQFILSTLTHGLGGHEFPDLLKYLISNRKTIIYCATIELCWRVAVYLWRFMPPGPEKLRRIRLYHAMCWPDENEETVRLIRDDPRCQIVIATIAFGQGFNVKTLVDSIQLGVAVTLDQTEQERGRVGRDSNTVARGIVLIQPSAIEAARKHLSVHSMSIAPSMPTTRARKTKVAATFDHGKALLLVETDCLISFLNKTYGNTSSTSHLDCVTGDRPLPCSNCMPRSTKTLKFPPSPLPANTAALPSFPAPPAPIISAKRPQKTKTLTKKMRDQASQELLSFGDDLYKRERSSDLYGYQPRSSYFSNPSISHLIDSLSTITTVDDIRVIIPQWRYHSQHGARLVSLLVGLQLSFDAQREAARLERNEKSRAKAQAARLLALPATAADIHDVRPTSPPATNPPTRPSESLPMALSKLQEPPAKDDIHALPRGHKRPALASATNVPAKRVARAALQSSAEVAKSFGPVYRTRIHSLTCTQTDENSVPQTRKSARLSRS